MHLQRATTTSDKHANSTSGIARVIGLLGVPLLCLPLVAGACKGDSSKEGETAKEAAVSPSEVPTEEAKKKTPPKEAQAALVTVELDGLGYVIDAPSDWPLKKLGEGIFTFRLKPISYPGNVSVLPSVTVTMMAMGPDTVEAVAGRCTGKSLESGTKDAAMFHNCETEAAGITMRLAEYITKVEDSYLACSASGLDFALMNQVCSSLRKKE
jgi:hypothetical protein